MLLEGMRYLCFVLVFFSCSDDTLRVVPCDPSCYTGPRDTEGKGICHAGSSFCIDGELAECIGEVTPQYEECDGVDNNCDGQVDEHLSKPGFLDGCLSCGRCFWSQSVCVLGNWTCSYEVWPEEHEIACDGKDEDCDCIADEAEDLYPTPHFCYDYPPNTALNGPCRPGLIQCVEGVEQCIGQVGPEFETCNDVDDDCNGIVDDTTLDFTGVDMVLAVDVSGSMQPYLEAVSDTICAYTESSTYRFAVLAFGSVGAYPIRIVSNLSSDVTQACAAMSLLPAGIGEEPSITAAQLVVDPTNPLGFDWNVGTKHIFVGFTDEVAQVQSGDASEEALDTDCGYALVYWFTTLEDVFIDQASLCAGEVFSLSESSRSMKADLESIIQEACLAEVVH